MTKGMIYGILAEKVSRNESKELKNHNDTMMWQWYIRCPEFKGAYIIDYCIIIIAYLYRSLFWNPKAHSIMQIWSIMPCP